MMFIAANHNDSMDLSKLNNSEKILLNSNSSISTSNDMNNDFNSIDSICKKRIRNKFTPEEDQKLRELIKKHGEHSWNLVSSLMENRNQRQCRERWKHYLSCDMTEASKPWTKEEDSILLNKYNELGAKWTKIALELPGRTDLQVKSRYLKNLKNKRNRRARESDETESDDEILPDEFIEFNETKNNKEKKENKNHVEIFSNIDTEMIEKAFASMQPQQLISENKHEDQQQFIADITLGKPNNDSINTNNELDFGLDLAPSNLIKEFFQFNNNSFLNQGFETEIFNWTFE